MRFDALLELSFGRASFLLGFFKSPFFFLAHSFKSEREFRGFVLITCNVFPKEMESAKYLQSLSEERLDAKWSRIVLNSISKNPRSRTMSEEIMQKKIALHKNWT